jgi:hypothetical protein
MRKFISTKQALTIQVRNAYKNGWNVFSPSLPELGLYFPTIEKETHLF